MFRPEDLSAVRAETLHQLLMRLLVAPGPLAHGATASSWNVLDTRAITLFTQNQTLDELFRVLTVLSQSEADATKDMLAADGWVVEVAVPSELWPASSPLNGRRPGRFVVHAPGIEWVEAEPLPLLGQAWGPPGPTSAARDPVERQAELLHGPTHDSLAVRQVMRASPELLDRMGAVLDILRLQNQQTGDIESDSAYRGRMITILRTDEGPQVHRGPPQATIALRNLVDAITADIVADRDEANRSPADPFSERTRRALTIARGLLLAADD